MFSLERWASQSTYHIKEITGPVRWTPLWDEASEGHTVQNLGQEVILNEASLAQEGSLYKVRGYREVRIRKDFVTAKTQRFVIFTHCCQSWRKKKPLFFNHGDLQHTQMENISAFRSKRPHSSDGTVSMYNLSHVGYSQVGQRGNLGDYTNNGQTPIFNGWHKRKPSNTWYSVLPQHLSKARGLCPQQT